MSLYGNVKAFSFAPQSAPPTSLQNLRFKGDFNDEVREEKIRRIDSLIHDKAIYPSIAIFQS